MISFIDNYLNKITMYRLVLYFLFVLLAFALVLSFFGILSFKPLDLVFSALLLTAVCWLANQVFAWAFEVPANAESFYITAWILALIITPPTAASTNYFSGLMFLFWAGVLSMAMKYILAFRGKHFFNPAAFAVVVTSFTIGQSASWWTGTLWMLPLVVIGGLLVTRKLQRFDLVLSFLAVAIISIILASPSRNQPLFLLDKILVDSPIIFFATIMLTEPMTTPPSKKWRMGYGAFVGLLFGPAVHIGSIYTTPELALLAGNLFSYAVSPKTKYLLTLKSKKEAAQGIYNFIFQSNRPIKFQPGQYLEWTVGHKKPDTRGNRRYFTIASSPTENEVHLGVRFYENPSSYKRALQALEPGSQVLAGQLAGEFTLPNNPDKKLVFIAGGIGITPFRSMIKYLTDKNEKRDITLFYCNYTDSQIAYHKIFEEAQKNLGIKTVNILTNQMGRLSMDRIAGELPDFMERDYYISGSRSMVVDFEKTLKSLGIPKNQIKIDFFPGFA